MSAIKLIFWGVTINIVLAIGLFLIGIALGFRIYQDTESILLAIYASGFLTIYGVLAAYPKGGIKKNDFENYAKKPKWHALSGIQTSILLGWFLVYGAYLIYHFEFQG